MLETKKEGTKVTIDVRERIKRGEHPRNEIFDCVKNSPKGTLFEIHLPHRAEPLINGLSSFGLNVVVNQLAPDHFRLMTVKLEDF